MLERLPPRGWSSPIKEPHSMLTKQVHSTYVMNMLYSYFLSRAGFSN